MKYNKSDNVHRLVRFGPSSQYRRELGPLPKFATLRVACFDKSKVLKYLLLCILTVVFLSSCASIGMDNLPKGELIKQSVSPNKKYRIDAFLCGGNATTDNSLKCAVVEIGTNNSRNFFWQYHNDTANIKWIDNKNVEINGKKLNIFYRFL